MKILFASDTSFDRFDAYPGDAHAHAAMAAPAALFAAADFSMVNLENIFGEPTDGAPIPKSGPNMISSRDFMEFIRTLNPTVVGLANNHTKDFGETPMLNTLRWLREEGFTAIGAGENLTDAYKPAILEKDGVRVAIFAVCENEFGCATDTVPGTAGYALSRVSHAIRDAKADGCLPIIYFHGGNEHNPFPSPGKVELYRHFIELGAEAVIAMHTHCPQGYEYYEGKPIVYSMGNFFFPVKGDYTPSWNWGYMTELEIAGEKMTVTPHPYRFDADGITLLAGEELSHFMEYLRVISAPIGDAAEMQAWFDSWCMTQGYIYTLSNFKREMFADGFKAVIPPIKNIFGCEAHNELVRNTLYMIYEERVEAARPRVELIRKLQAMEVI